MRTHTYTVASTIAAGILGLAAALKLYSLKADPDFPANGLATSALIIAEAWLAAWLLSRWKAPAARWTAIVFFALFACVSLGKGLKGLSSCGCFGSFQTDPWLVFTGDLVLVGSLVYSRPQQQQARGSLRALLPAVSMAWAIPVTFVAVVSASWAEASPAVPGLFVDAVSNTAILEPEEWLGSGCPLDKLTDLGETIHGGEWLVVFFHHDCPHCQELLSLLKGRADLNTKLALVEVPPFDDVGSDRHHGLANAFGRLKGRYDWFIEAPTVIRVRQGTVVRVESPLQEPLAGSLQSFLDDTASLSSVSAYAGRPKNEG